jgi:hypothetical protein
MAGLIRARNDEHGVTAATANGMNGTTRATSMRRQPDEPAHDVRETGIASRPRGISRVHGVNDTTRYFHREIAPSTGGLRQKPGGAPYIASLNADTNPLP